jgi:hypothetical protein
MRRNSRIVAAAAGALGIAGLAGVAVSSAGEVMRQPLTCTSADAVRLPPLAASTVTLGAYTGVAYYTAETSGHQVVATVAPGEGGAPIRFVSTLADGQHVLLSVPQAVGLPALEVEFQRCGEAMHVRGPASLPPAVAVAQ